MRYSVLIAAMVAVVAAWCTPLFAQQVPQVLYYRFNEGTGTTTTNHAVPGSGTATLPLNTGHTWVAGQLNGCIRATAPGSMITGLAPNFTNNDSFTIEFWIRGAATTTLGYIMGESSTSVRIFTGGAAPSPGGILWQSAGGWSQCSATGFFDGTWHHCAFVFDSIAKTMTLYRDGVQAGQSVNQTAGALISTNWRIGDYNGSVATFLGDMDEYRFWNVARTQAEIQANMNVELFPGPQLTVAATAGTAQTVFANDQGPGGAGINTGRFDISSNGQSPNSELSGIDITASGTGDDAAAISEISLYRDHPTLGTLGVFDPADEIIDAPKVFTADNGTVNFVVQTAQQAFGLSETRTYFVITKLAGTALPGHTFNFTVSDIAVSAGLKNVPANSTMNGLIIDTPQFVFSDFSAGSQQTVFLTATGVCQEFTIGYANGPDNKPARISVSSLGTAHEVDDLNGVQLWWDSNNDSTFNATSDTLVNTQVFTSDDGTVVFSLATHPDFVAGQTRRYFVVYDLNANADNHETFKCYVSAMGAASLGGNATGLPLPSANGTQGLDISAAILFGIMNGPLATTSVDANWAGPTGDGELIADVTLDALPGGAWTVSVMQFNAAGIGDHNIAYAELALYEDNGNNTWDGPGTETLAAPVATGFSANSVSFTLVNTSLPAAAQRRFFLAAKLSGLASTGETFGARLEGLTFVPPSGGQLSGFPTAATTALVIDTPVVTVANSPLQPATATHASGTIGDLLAAAFRITALNGPADVSGFTLTTGGTGDWTTDVDSTAGVQVYMDNGDEVFDAATDNLLFLGGGGTTVAATFSTAVSLAVGGTADLWIAIGFTATAGQGNAAAPETFNVSIAAAGDVNATVPVVLGMNPPVGIDVGAIEFSVSSFAPNTAVPAGGQDISITGSGFMAPFSVTIGGTLCAGTAVINGGTDVTGLQIPPGFGKLLPIVVYSGTLPPQTITQTFDYLTPKDNIGDSSTDTSSCSGVGGSAWAGMLGVLALLGVAAARRRRA
jgi:hypothetical protein